MIENSTDTVLLLAGPPVPIHWSLAKWDLANATTPKDAGKR
jgi:hypothetical protein